MFTIEARHMARFTGPVITPLKQVEGGRNLSRGNDRCQLASYEQRRKVGRYDSQSLGQGMEDSLLSLPP